MDRYRTLADTLGNEVLTEMAGTFFGVRKSVEDMVEDFHLHVEDLRAREAKVFSRVFYLRSLLLGHEGESAFFARLGLRAPFDCPTCHPGSRTWHPDRLPFALRATTRFARAVLQAYAELRHACEVYMSGEYEGDPNRRGRKRLSPHYLQLEGLCERLNERVEKLNTEMSPSLVLQYARNINSADQPGQGVLASSLGAESLDRGLMFPKVDFAALGVWKAPDLPPVEQCEADIRDFCELFFARNAPQIKKVLADLD